MQKFFVGRNLDSEAKRFLTLTRYGQSRAVSEGIPTLLWIDPKAGTYGLEQEPGYQEDDAHSQQFTIAEGLSIGVDTSVQAGAKAFKAGKRMGIRFSPDGNLIVDTSVKAVFIKEANGQQVSIVQTPDRLSYEVKS
jgi:hypothetical protein